MSKICVILLAASCALSAAEKKRPEPLRLSSKLLNVEVLPDGSIAVTDKRNHRQWRHDPMSATMPVVVGRRIAGQLEYQVFDEANQRVLSLVLRLDEMEAAFDVSWIGPDAALPKPIAYPPPLATARGMWLVVPMNEGILYPVDDASIKPFQLAAYSGHGISMPWFGVTDPATGAGMMSLILSPDDARIEIARPPSGLLTIRPVWESSRGRMRYPRRLRMYVFDKGGYVAQAKCYRRWAVAQKLFKSLETKRAENPNVDLLMGAANVWFFDKDHVGMARQLQAAGMDKVLWSAGVPPDDVRALNELGYLTSRYDIYQDVWPPDAPGLKHDGWPDDLVWLPNLEWMKGWASHRTNKDGTQTILQGGVINSARGLARAKQQIPENLKTHPFRCRFIDTTTAAAFKEDYNPAHQLTRSEDRQNKMALLDFCSGDMHLVTGSETGIDSAVPFVHYFEGMLSLGRYRLPDAGRNMIQYKPPTPDFLKFQVGHYYRAPLWELVYHDCVVSQWYWGDYNNKAPEVWDRRDLFNLLYGTPPMFMFNRGTWNERQARFVRSYKNTCPSARRLGYREMLSHEFLTADHSVQRTTWSGGAAIVVNFSDAPYKLAGRTVPPLGFDVHF
jgi:hypothetical protein